MTGFANVQRFRVFWRNEWQPTTLVEVDTAARRLYQGENAFEVAAALACIEKKRDRTQIRDVREV